MGMGIGEGLALLFVLLFAVGLIALAVWVVSLLFPRGSRPMAGGVQTPTAREILDQRYARGEISREEYAQMKQDLSDRQV